MKMLRGVRPAVCVSFALAGVFCLGGCAGSFATKTGNPTFPITVDDARSELLAMSQSPVALERPLVVFGGYGDTGGAARDCADLLRIVFGEDAPIDSFAFFFDADFDKGRTKAIARIRRRFGDGPIDAVGISMGGLIARYSAMDVGPSEGLEIVTLFTMGTPHRGLRDFTPPPIDAKVRAMLPESGMLELLDAQTDRPAIVPYVRLGDGIVGPRNSAPEGIDVIWMPNKRFSPAHLEMHEDERIIADIARRLRREASYVLEPRAPLPGGIEP